MKEEGKSHADSNKIYQTMFSSHIRRFLTPLRNMKIVPVPVRDDNYAYLLIDEPSNSAAAVDPYDVAKVRETADRLGVKLVAGITTHHHFDHSGGNEVPLVVLPVKPISDPLSHLGLCAFDRTWLAILDVLIVSLGLYLSRRTHLWGKPSGSSFNYTGQR